MQEKIDTEKLSSFQSRKPALSMIFATVFIYLVGFGIIIPLIPLLSRDYGATAFQSGLLMSCYSLMQFLFAPFWGKLSDRYGRRPILLFCLLCEFFCYLLFAFSHNLIMLFIARSLAGFFGASLSTASAYISDITTQKERSRGMALIGVAFGLGFMIGPALGGFLSQLGEWILHQNALLPHWIQGTNFIKTLPMTLPSFFVAALCLCNFLFGLRYLGESKGFLQDQTPKQHKTKRINILLGYLRKETIGTVLIIFFISSFAMSSMEATFILFMKDKFLWTVRDVSFGFAYIGLIMIFTQGFLARRMLPRFGERQVLAIGFTLLTLGFFLIGYGETIFAVALAVTFMALGSALINPSAMGSVSLLSPHDEQGQSMGVTQSLSALGRILGPALGGFLYSYFSKQNSTTFSSAPFYFSAIMGMFGLFLIARTYSQLPETAKLVQNK